MRSNAVRWLLPSILPYGWSLGGTGLCLMVQSTISLAIPWLVGQLAGPLLRGTLDAPSTLAPLLLLLLGLCALQALSSFGMVYVVSRTTEPLMMELRTYVYDFWQALPVSF